MTPPALPNNPPDDRATGQIQRSALPSRRESPLGGYSFGDLAIAPKERFGIQTKLAIGRSGDQYEQEADRVADQVMRMPATDYLARVPLANLNLPASHQTPLQRQEMKEKEEEKNKRRIQTKKKRGQTPKVTSELEERLQASQGKGQPLPEETRAFMETRFGHDFSQVRVHTDAGAVQMNQDLNAQAFTLGHRIYFGTGKYLPSNSSVRRLLAHELTHVVQQRGATVGKLKSKDSFSQSAEAYKQEAESVNMGEKVAITNQAAPDLLQRDENKESKPEKPSPVLPSGVLLDQAMTRLEEPQMIWLRQVAPPVDSLWKQLIFDAAGVTNESEEVVRDRADRLNTMLQRVAPVIGSLQQLSPKENYLPGIADAINEKVMSVVGMYAAAIISAYSDLLIDKTLLSNADKELAALPDFITQQYLSKGGIESFIGQLGYTIFQIGELRAMAHRPNIARSSQDPDKPLLDDILEISHPKGVYQLKHDLLQDLQGVRRATKTDVSKLIAPLTHQVHAYAVIAQAGVFYEQFAYWKSLLAEHPILDSFPSREKTCDKYLKKLDNIISSLEPGWWTSTPPSLANTLLAGAEIDLSSLLQSSEFVQDTKDIAERLKTIATINVIGKIVLITAAAALVAGVAAAGVGAALEAGGASTLVVGGGELAAEALAFTAVSRLGQEIAFGKAEGSFAGDLLTNVLMLGVLKATTLGYGKIFKAFADPKVYKVTYGLGKAGVGLATLHMFSEAQHAILTGKLMSQEERYRSLIQNIIMLGALEAAGFITRPIHERFGTEVAKIFGLDKRFATDLAALQKQQADLQTVFEALKRSNNPDVKDIEALLKGMQELWVKELALLKRGMQRHAINQEQYDAAIKNYDAASARLELQLANLGIDSPGSTQDLSFKPIRPGVVSYTQGSESVIESFYKEKGGTLTRKQDGMLEGRLPTGEVTFYVPAAEVPKTVVTQSDIAKARDQAEREASTNPLVRQGLDNLAKLMSHRKADAVLASAADIVALLSALADPGFKQSLGALFYERFAREPWAINFTRAYGADILDNLYRRYGWEKLPEILQRAAQKLENAPTAEARKELHDNLRDLKDSKKLDALLDKPSPPKPPKPVKATKKTMGVNRSAADWKVYRNEQQKLAELRGETLTDDQLDIRADLQQIVAAAKAKQFKDLGRSSKISILDRFDELAKDSGMAQSAINGMRGDLAEVLFNPGYFKKKSIFLSGVKQPQNISGATVPDYDISHTGFTEWVDLKSDLIDQGTKQKDGSFDAGVKAASKYLDDAKKDATNIPSGDKISLDFIRDPGPVTRRRMLQILFGTGSPIYRVKFGDVPWVDRTVLK